MGRVWPAAAGRQFPAAKPCRQEDIGINTGVSGAAERVCEDSGWRANKSATIKGTSVYLLSESSSKAGGVSLLIKCMWLVVVLWLGMRLISPHDKACLSLTLSQILLLLLASFLPPSSCSGVGRTLFSLLAHTGSLLASWNFETTSFPSPTRSYNHPLSPRQPVLRISSAMSTEHPLLLYTPLCVPMYSFMRLSPDLPATCSSNFLLSR